MSLKMAREHFLSAAEYGMETAVYTSDKIIIKVISQFFVASEKNLKAIDGTDTEDSRSVKHQPSPSDFDEFLPWACAMLQVPELVIIGRITQDDYVSVGLSPGKGKKKKGNLSKVDVAPEREESFTKAKAIFSQTEEGINVLVMYDACQNLVKLNFEKTRHLPRVIFKIIGLIIKFHYYLHTLCVSKGLDNYGVYEISKFLPFSRITDLCLDNTFIEEGNYHVLLEQRNLLKHLSLSRCSINDEVVERLASMLFYPLPASKTLCILNLSCNKITDIGAKHLGDALRSNRQLGYLNLSGNMLTDEGAEYILDTLLKFPLKFEEQVASRSRHMTYLKEKKETIIRLVKELRAGDFEKRAAKRKSVSAGRSVTTPKKKGLDKESSLKSVPEAKSLPNMEAIFLEKATAMAENILGDYCDPFDKDNTIVTDGVVYSQGNNTLAYLSMAYNNLSYTTLKKLLKVLLYQKVMGRKPKGLMNVSVEGNMLPVMCKELAQIDDLLETSLMVHSRRYSLTKKRAPSRSGSGK